MCATPLTPGRIASRRAAGSSRLNPGTSLAEIVGRGGVVREHEGKTSAIGCRVVPFIAIGKSKYLFSNAIIQLKCFAVVGELTGIRPSDQKICSKIIAEGHRVFREIDLLRGDKHKIIRKGEIESVREMDAI